MKLHCKTKLNPASLPINFAFRKLQDQVSASLSLSQGTARETVHFNWQSRFTFCPTTHTSVVREALLRVFSTWLESRRTGNIGEAISEHQLNLFCSRAVAWTNFGSFALAHQKTTRFLSVSPPGNHRGTFLDRHLKHTGEHLRVQSMVVRSCSKCSDVQTRFHETTSKQVWSHPNKHHVKNSLLREADLDQVSSA